MQKQKAQKSAVFLPKKSMKKQTTAHKPTLSSTSDIHPWVGGSRNRLTFIRGVGNDRMTEL